MNDQKKKEKNEENNIQPTNRLNVLNHDTLSNKSDDSRGSGSNSDDDNNTSKYSAFYGNNNNETKYDFKVILIGDISVGKTSIFERFMSNKFSGEYKCTLTGQAQGRLITLNNKTTVNLQIWDTSGEEKFKSITRLYYNNSNGILIVFDLNNKPTFDSVKKWLKDVQNYGPKKLEIIIIGNKSDLDEREVKTEEAQLFAERVNATYLEVSAKNGTNILLLFEFLSNRLVKKFQNSQFKEEEKEINISSKLVLFNQKNSKAEKILKSLREKEKTPINSCC